MSHPAHEPPTYPRTYRSIRQYVVVSRVTAALMVAVVVYGMIARTVGWIHDVSPPAQIAFYFALLLFLAVFMWWQSGWSATLDQNAITVTSWGSTRTLRRDQIRGRRFIPSGWRRLSRHILLPADPAERAMKLPPEIPNDHVLQAWLRDIPLEHR